MFYKIKDVKPLDNFILKVTFENKDSVLENMKMLADKCINVYAKEYFSTLEK